MSLSRTVFGSEFQMAGAVQRNARFAIVVLVNGRHSPGVADRLRSYGKRTLNITLKDQRLHESMRMTGRDHAEQVVAQVSG